MKRKTDFIIKQVPGKWAMQVIIHSFDGEISITKKWTWLGWLLQKFLKETSVKVTRKRELMLNTKGKK